MIILLSVMLAAAAPLESAAQETKTAAAAELKTLLSDGLWKAGRPVSDPFLFRHENGLAAKAQNRGLEGFYYTKLELEEKFGPQAFASHYNDYFLYTGYLLSRIPALKPWEAELGAIKNSGGAALKRNSEFNSFAARLIAELQKQYLAQSPYAWAKSARIYQIFPRAYNPEGRRGGAAPPASGKFFRDFRPDNFAPIQAMGFDTIWVMGIYPVGERNRSGSAGGSVYSVRDMLAINPELGTTEDFAAFVAAAHKAGLKVVIDLIGNHTSMDSALLAEYPDYFINLKPGESQTEPPPGYFEYSGGGRRYWIRHGGYDCGEGRICDWNDTAQLDYANPKLREKLIGIALELVKRYDIDGFRVDMAYQNLNEIFRRNWNACLPEEEFFTKLISGARKAKPSTAFIAEAYANQDELSAAGFDLFYNKTEWGRLEGQAGWYDAFMHANPAEINAAISRAAFLSWQKAGAGGLAFFINHDEPAAKKVFGARLPAVAALTMLLPGAFLFYNGAEIGADYSVPGEPKTLPFGVPVKINWQAGDAQTKQMFKELFALTAKTRNELGAYDIQPLYPPKGASWCGYVMAGATARKAVIANATDKIMNCAFKSAKWNFGFNGKLKPGEYKIIELP